MNILIDTNVILDFAIKRDEFYKNSILIFKIFKNTNHKGYLTASTITDIYYIVKKVQGHQSAVEFLRSLIGIFKVLGVNSEIIEEALNKDFPDFEDGVQTITAEKNTIDLIITRNKKDFENTNIDVYSPVEFLKLYSNT